MKFSSNQGIEIDETVKKMIETAIGSEGSQNRFALAIGVPAQNVQNWRGTGSRVGEYILWDQWEKIKPYFIRNGYISADDVRWMTPDEMRLRLSAQLADDERAALELYRLMTDDGKTAALATLKGLANTFNKADSASVG